MTDDNSRRTLMHVTPGITCKKFCRDPLGTEGELTSGPDQANPFRSPQEREIVEAYRAREKEHEDSKAFKTSGADARDTGGIDHPLHTTDPSEGNDPFAFDDIGTFELPGFGNIDPTNDDGPQF